jgi:WD40 repeat protein
MARHALIVGLNSYSDSNLKPLGAPSQDAEQIYRILTKYGKFDSIKVLPLDKNTGEDKDIYREKVNPKRVLNAKALKEALIELFNPESCNAPNMAFFYFAGHGIREKDGVYDGYLATSDTKIGSNNLGVSLSWLRRLLDESPVKQQVIVLDCCHSGQLVDSFKDDLRKVNLDRAFDVDRCFIASCLAFQTSYATSANGLFTAELLKALDPTNGEVTGQGLSIRLRAEKGIQLQQPICENSGSDIVLTSTGAIKPTFAYRADRKSLPCPYKGLEAFEHTGDDPYYFYGRMKETDELIERVKQEPFTVIAGSSGSGKSSLLKAGLIYELNRGGKLFGSVSWRKYLFRPGEAPLSRLIRQFAGKTLNKVDDSDLGNNIFRSIDNITEHNIKEVIEFILQDAPRCMIAIDQFEDCFSPECSRVDREQFFHVLKLLVDESKGRLGIVITLRDEFLGRCLESEDFKYLMSLSTKDAMIVSTPMASELTLAIQKPANQVGFRIDYDLVSQMIDDVKSEAGSLPLLQYTLQRLWETYRSAQNLLITIDDYNNLGGLQQCLQDHLENIYSEFSPIHQKIAEYVFLSLIRFDGDVLNISPPILRSSFLLNEIYSKRDVDYVVQKLLDERLIVSSRLEKRGDISNSEEDAEVDIAHRTLILKWKRLNQWIEMNKSALKLKQDLESEARNWELKSRSKDFLLRGKRLTEAEKLLQRSFLAQRKDNITDSASEKAGIVRVNLTKNAKDLIQASQVARRRSRITWSIAGTIGTIVLGLGFWKWGVMQRGIVLEQEGTNSIRQFPSGELDSLKSAMKVAQELSSLTNASGPIGNYPAVSPLLALQKILDEIYEQNHFSGNQGEIRGAVFLPGTDRFITAGEGTDKGGVLKIWSSSGDLVSELEGHETGVISGGVKGIAIGGNQQSPLIASAGGDGAVMVWDKDGKRVSNLEVTGQKEKKPFTTIAVSTDGQRVAAGQSNGMVYLWERSGKLLKSWSAHGQEVTGVAFSGDGQKVATSSEDGLARVWTLAGNKTAELKVPSVKKVMGISFSPDGKWIVTASDDRIARIWTVAGQEVKRLEGHEGLVTVANFSPDGEMVATAADDGTVKLWNAKTGQKLQDFRGHRGVVWTASFSQDGKRLVSTGRDGEIRFWNLSNANSPVTTLPGFTDDVNAIVFSPDGKTIVGAGNEGVMRQWDRNGKELKVWKEAIFQKKNVQDLAFSSEGKLLLASGLTSIARVWKVDEANTDEPFIKLKGGEDTEKAHRGDILSIAASPDGTVIATGSSDKTIRIWKIDPEYKEWKKNPQYGKFVVVTPEQEGVVSRVAFTADGQRIISADWAGSVTIWSLDGKPIQQFKNIHPTQIRGLGVTRDGSRIVTADKMGDIKILDASGKILKEFKSYQSGINELTISPDGQLIATAGMDKTARVWDFQGRQVAEFENPKGAVWGVAFSPDNRSIAFSGDKGFAVVRSIDRLDDLLTKGFKWLKKTSLSN